VRLRVPSGIGHRNMLLVNVAADGAVEMPDAEGESFLRAGRAALSANREILRADYERLTDLVRTKRGDDILPSLEARLEHNNELIDLLAVWDEIFRRQDHERIVQYGVELFRRQHTAHIALAVAVSFANLERFADSIVFLDQCSDLIDSDRDLAACKAWALFYVGRFEDAWRIVDRLIRAEGSPDLDMAILEINLSVATARWEHFGTYSIGNGPVATNGRQSIYCSSHSSAPKQIVIAPCSWPNLRRRRAPMMLRFWGAPTSSSHDLAATTWGGPGCCGPRSCRKKMGRSKREACQKPRQYSRRASNERAKFRLLSRKVVYPCMWRVR
jgi:hypothetical protein